MRSLQARMFLVFALIATIPLLAMSYLALTFTKRELEAEIGNANGEAATAAASFAAVYVENARVLLDAEARSPAMRQAVLDDDPAAELLAVEGLRERAAYEGVRLFRGVVLVDEEGVVVAAAPPEAADQVSDGLHSGAIAAARAQRRSVVAPVPAAGEPVVPLATPVLVNGTVRAVLVADLSLVGLARGLEPFSEGARTVFLTDGDGRLIAHPDADVLAQRPDLSALRPIELAGRTDAGYVEYDDPALGERALGSFATIPRLGWIVVHTVPTSAAYGALQNLTGILIGLSGLLVGAILLASIAVARRIVAPVQELTEASRSLAEGKLARRIEPAGADEIAELGSAFNQMADRIAESLEGLRRSESRYRSLVESASDLIFTVLPGGEISFASPMMRRVLGKHPEPGSPAADLVHPDDQEAFRATIRRVVERREPALYVPFRLLAGESGPRDVLTNFTPIFDEGDEASRVLAVAHDVTEERREQRLREKAFRMAQLVSEETALESLAKRGLLLMLSEGGPMRGALYLDRGGALRETARANLPDAAPFADLAARARTEGAPVRGELRGEAALAVPLVEHGEVIGAIVLAGPPGALDGERAAVFAPLASQLAVGLRRSLFEQRLKEYAAELESRVAERTSELTQKSDEMEQFLYSVSHDLKAPLISIQGYAQSLEEDYARSLAGEGAIYLERIRKNASLMESLILDLLELSRIGRSRGDTESIDMEKLFTDIAARMAGRFSAVEGELHVDRPLPAVEAEPRRLAQLFTNLVDNAVKYRHPGRAPVVRIWADDGEETVVYHVKDNGRGIAARYHDQLFKIFQRIPTSDMEDPGGTGMGLAIVKRIAEMQGGSVSFDSEEGVGTTFHVELPKRRSA